ncbi:MAG TPA: hypothetical protein VKX25_09685 [Bryobacteraceae bacterium]|nr:hypothetical protein [Bryobacteraceae bacterium]
MSFLTLEKYLSKPHSRSAAVREKAESVGAEPAREQVNLLDSVLGSVAGSIFSGEGLHDLCEELEALRRNVLNQQNAQELTQSAQRFDSLLVSFQERLRKADEERADDFRKVLATLNDAFLHLSSSSDRRDTTWKQLESSLKLASRSEDLRTLKQQLSELIEYVNRESKQESAQAAETLEALGTRVQWAQQAASKLNTSFATKEEALALLQKQIKSTRTGPQKPFAAMFTLDALTALRNRHGSDVANALLDDFSRTRVQQTLPGSKMFRWSPESIVAMWESERELPDQVVAVSNSAKDPFEFRTFVGTRVASFSIPFRTVVTAVQGSPEDIVFSFDRFVRGV